MDAASIETGLRTTWMGCRVLHSEVVDSTNDVAWKLAENDYPSGTAVFADRQQRGRGSRGRIWHAGPGQSLLFSVILRFELPPGHIAGLTATASIAVVRAVRECIDVPLQVLWPNDLVIGDRKAGGILVESRSPGPAGPTYIVGTGLNVLQEADDFPPDVRDLATSLRVATGLDLDRTALASRILECMEVDFERLRQGDIAPLDDLLRAHSAMIGRRVELDLGDRGTLVGVVTDVDLFGQIRMRRDSGGEQIVDPVRVRHKRLLDAASPADDRSAR